MIGIQKNTKMILSSLAPKVNHELSTLESTIWNKGGGSLHLRLPTLNISYILKYQCKRTNYALRNNSRTSPKLYPVYLFSLKNQQSKFPSSGVICGTGKDTSRAPMTPHTRGVSIKSTFNSLPSTPTNLPKWNLIPKFGTRTSPHKLEPSA